MSMQQMTEQTQPAVGRIEELGCQKLATGGAHRPK